MNQKEKDLIYYFLEQMSDHYSNHGSNDIDEEIFKNWSLKERKQLAKEYNEYEDNEDEDENIKDVLELSDTCLMGFLAYKLKNNL